MPIADENKHYYAGEKWQAIRREILERAGNCCEGSPNHYPSCKVENRKIHPVTSSIVVLTIAHLDHDPGNNDLRNLRALCQRCHLAHDAKQHAQTRADNRRKDQRKAGQMELDLI